MGNVKRICRDGEKGSAQVIEMTLIFPFVLLCMFLLIYLCSYILQGIYIYNSAQKIAVAACREAAYPGYGNLYEDYEITSKADFNWEDGYAPAISIINKIMEEHNPYRYWGDSFLSQDKKNALERNLERLINSSSFLAASNVECTITTCNNILVQRVEVRVIKSIDLPDVFSYLGLAENINIDVDAVAVVEDSAEFIRNTDMVFDMTEYMFENFKIGKSGQTINERIKIYKQKISDISSKLGLEW